jgi:hypothetical protein
MNSCVPSRGPPIDPIPNGPSAWLLSQMANPDITMMASVAPREPKRSATQISAGSISVHVMPVPVSAIALSPMTPAAVTVASSTLVHRHVRGSGRAQPSASGNTISAPERSPSHQVRQTCGSELKLIAAPSHDAIEPIVALSTVPTDIATTMPPTPRTVASGSRREERRRRSSAATITSSRFAEALTEGGTDRKR